MIKKRHISRLSIFAITLVFLCSVSNAEQVPMSGNFLTTIEDIPVAPGMTELHSEKIIFETVGGRIAEAQVVGRKTPNTVRAFYRETLPQLGWKRIRNDIYYREDEILSINVTRSGNDTLATFMLKPKNN